MLCQAHSVNKDWEARPRTDVSIVLLSSAQTLLVSLTKSTLLEGQTPATQGKLSGNFFQLSLNGFFVHSILNELNVG